MMHDNILQSGEPDKDLESPHVSDQVWSGVARLRGMTMPDDHDQGVIRHDQWLIIPCTFADVAACHITYTVPSTFPAHTSRSSSEHPHPILVYQVSSYLSSEGVLVFVRLKSVVLTLTNSAHFGIEHLRRGFFPPRWPHS
jgi:hypothetical protein